MNLENIRRHEMDIEEERNAYADMPGQNYSDANISDASVEKGSKVIAGKKILLFLLATILFLFSIKIQLLESLTLLHD